MSRFGIRVVGIAGPIARPGNRDAAGKWVQSFDADAHDGRGDAVLTGDPSRAIAFDSFADAMAFWRQTSTVRPTRPDGQPNRPLTAFTVAIEPLPDDG